jgi:hypothetical protein
MLESLVDQQQHKVVLHNQSNIQDSHILLLDIDPVQQQIPLLKTIQRPKGYLSKIQSASSLYILLIKKLKIKHSWMMKNIFLAITNHN